MIAGSTDGVECLTIRKAERAPCLSTNGWNGALLQEGDRRVFELFGGPILVSFAIDC